MAPAQPSDAIDRLYQLPLADFVRARNELARQRRGEEAQAIRTLAKPNVAAWALNQVYWSSRPVFDRLLAAAGALREAQAETLRGRPADLRAADRDHREAVGAAVAAASRILVAAGHPVAPDTRRSLTAAFDALPWTEPPGRLVTPPSAAGFGAFAGLPTTGEEMTAPPRQPAVAGKRSKRDDADRAATGDARAADAKRLELEARTQQAREAVEEARRVTAAAEERLRGADEELAGARAQESSARRQLDDARRLVEEAEGARLAARRELAAATAAGRKAEAAARRTVPAHRKA